MPQWLWWHDVQNCYFIGSLRWTIEPGKFSNNFNSEPTNLSWNGSQALHTPGNKRIKTEFKYHNALPCNNLYSQMDIILLRKESLIALLCAITYIHIWHHFTHYLFYCGLFIGYFVVHKAVLCHWSQENVGHWNKSLDSFSIKIMHLNHGNILLKSGLDKVITVTNVSHNMMAVLCRIVWKNDCDCIIRSWIIWAR